MKSHVILPLIFVVATACSSEDSSALATIETSPLEALDLGSAGGAEQDLSGSMVVAEDRLNTALEAYDLVNSFVGTDGLGYAFSGITPAAQVPLGFIRVGPDTTRDGNHSGVQHQGGYNHQDPHLRGFSHTHFVGTGVADYGHFRVLPATDLDAAQSISDSWVDLDVNAQDASPGYYSIKLTKPNTTASMTASIRGAAHTYTFEPGDSPFLAFDTSSSITDSGIQDASVSMSPEGVLKGWVRYKGPYIGRKQAMTLYFHAEVQPKPTKAFLWSKADPATQAPSLQGNDLAALWQWPSTSEQQTVSMRLGVSMVSAEYAEGSLKREVPWSDSFGAIRERAKSAWLGKLSKVRVAGGTAREREIFFTSLYNTYRLPTRIDEHDGTYVGVDGKTHQADSAHYTDLSLWDTFRTTHPWFALVDHEVQRDCIRSLLRMNQDGGGMPRWPAGLSYTGGMIGSPADFLFAEGALKGVHGVDWDRALDALLPAATGPLAQGAGARGREAITAYIEQGYISSEDESESVARTLEYAWSDAAIANLATHTQREEVANRFLARSKSYQNLFDPELKFFRAKLKDNSWTPEFNPLAYQERGEDSYTEGTAWHYRFYVPHDAAGLQQLYGSKEALATELEAFFSLSKFRRPGPVRNFLPDRYYWHGNQPPLHSVYMFWAAGRYDRLLHWLDQIRERSYSTEPDGLSGNDDGGTLSAWYLFSAIGIYPIAGTDRYFIGSPLFSKVEVSMGNGATKPDTLTVVAPGMGPESRQISQIWLGQSSLTEDESFQGEIKHNALRNQTLRFFGGLD